MKKKCDAIQHNNIVKYHNDLNLVQFKDFTTRELNLLINRNIRCFEIYLKELLHLSFQVINRNIRCFEMLLSSFKTPQSTKINRNIRCFEIYFVK